MILPIEGETEIKLTLRGIYIKIIAALISIIMPGCRKIYNRELLK